MHPVPRLQHKNSRLCRLIISYYQTYEVVRSMTGGTAYKVHVIIQQTTVCSRTRLPLSLHRQQHGRPITNTTASPAVQL